MHLHLLTSKIVKFNCHTFPTVFLLNPYFEKKIATTITAQYSNTGIAQETERATVWYV